MLSGGKAPLLSDFVNKVYKGIEISSPIVLIIWMGQQEICYC